MRWWWLAGLLALGAVTAWYGGADSSARADARSSPATGSATASPTGWRAPSGPQRTASMTPTAGASQPLVLAVHATSSRALGAAGEATPPEFVPALGDETLVGKAAVQALSATPSSIPLPAQHHRPAPDPLRLPSAVSAPG